MKLENTTSVEMKSLVGSSHFMLFGWMGKCQIYNHFSCLVGGNETLEVVTSTDHGVWMGETGVVLTTSSYR